MSRLKGLPVATALLLFLLRWASAAGDDSQPNTVPGGCTYDGKHYASGEAIVVRDAPCVRCTCRLGVPECRVRMCLPLPDPPPRGCVIVQQQGACCAQLQCLRGRPENASLVEKILEAEKQKQEQLALDSNRVRSDGASDGTCILGGTRYAPGSALSSSSLCRHCFCVRGRERCVSPQCVLPAPGCKPVFRAPACCPVRYDCKEIGNNKTEVAGPTTLTKPHSKPPAKPTKSRGCVVSGRRYSDGASVPAAARSPCESCFCLRGRVLCAHSRCAGPLDGCTPIVAPGRCCPTSYDCGKTNITIASGYPPKLPGREKDEERESTVRSLGGSETPLPADGRSHRVMPTTGILPAQTPPASQIVTTVRPTIAFSDNENNAHKNKTSNTVATNNVSPTRDTNDTHTESRSMSSGVKTLPNKSQRKSDDYDYDYDESLHSSLPNLRIIPFVAADAVPMNDKSKDNVPQHPEEPVIRKEIADEVQIKTDSTDVKFSPPEETEGGFMPKQPALEGPFYETKLVVPLITADVNGPVVNSDSDSISGDKPNASTEEPNALPESGQRNPESDEMAVHTDPSKVNVKNGAICLVEGRSFRHGDLVSSPSACELCVCRDGEVQCRPPLCGPPPQGCRRLPRRGSCCGPILCGDDAKVGPTSYNPPGIHAYPTDETMIRLPTLVPQSTTGKPVKSPAVAPEKRSTTTPLIQTTAFTSPKPSAIVTSAGTTTSLSPVTTTTTTSTTTTTTTTERTSSTVKPAITITASPTTTISSTTSTTRSTTPTAPSSTSTEATTTAKPKTSPKLPSVTESGKVRLSNKPTLATMSTTSATSTTTTRSTTPMSLLQVLWGNSDNSENEAQDKVDQTYEDAPPSNIREEEDNDDSFSFDKVFELLFSSGEPTTKKPITRAPFIRPTSTTVKITSPQNATHVITSALNTTTEPYARHTSSTTSKPTQQQTTSTSLKITTRSSSTTPKTTTAVYITQDNSTTKKTSVHDTPVTYTTSTTQEPTTAQYVTRANSPVPTTERYVSASPTSSPALKSSTVRYATRTIPTTASFAPVTTPESKSTQHIQDSEIRNRIFSTTTTLLMTRSPTATAQPGSTTLPFTPSLISSQKLTTPKTVTTAAKTVYGLESFIPPPTRPSIFGRPAAVSKPAVQSSPFNVLKLAGCNIYGRMYRVGRIIIELSGPCKECSCTEFGVQCRHLIC